MIYIQDASALCTGTGCQYQRLFAEVRAENEQSLLPSRVIHDALARGQVNCSLLRGVADRYKVLHGSDSRQMRGVLSHTRIQKPRAVLLGDGVTVAWPCLCRCVRGGGVQVPDRASDVNSEERCHGHDVPRCAQQWCTREAPPVVRAQELQEGLLCWLEGLELVELVEDDPAPEELLEDRKSHPLPVGDRGVARRVGVLRGVDVEAAPRMPLRAFQEAPSAAAQVLQGELRKPSVGLPKEPLVGGERARVVRL